MDHIAKCQCALFGLITHLSEAGNIDVDAHTTAGWSESTTILALPPVDLWHRVVKRIDGAMLHPSPVTFNNTLCFIKTSP